jgi:hypothetical protein
VSTALAPTLVPGPDPEAVAREALAAALFAAALACTSASTKAWRAARAKLTDARTARLEWEATLWGDDQADAWRRCLHLAAQLDTLEQSLDEARVIVPGVAA